MDTLTLTAVEQVESWHESFRWRDKATEIWDALVERFYVIWELDTTGTAWPIVLTLFAALLLLFGLALTGWHHAAAGP